MTSLFIEVSPGLRLPLGRGCTEPCSGVTSDPAGRWEELSSGAGFLGCPVTLEGTESQEHPKANQCTAWLRRERKGQQRGRQGEKPSSKNTPLQSVAFQLRPTASGREAGPRRSFEGFPAPLRGVTHFAMPAGFLKGTEWRVAWFSVYTLYSPEATTVESESPSLPFQ